MRIPSSTSQGFSSCRGTIRRLGSCRAVGEAYTAVPGNWAAASRPVRPLGGVYTGWKCHGCGRKARRMVTADLLSRARAGDGEAFRELAEPHRRELQVHCYRMLGSFQDAEDALQDTLLSAWQGIGLYDGERASLRTWFYRIATNRCLNLLCTASRRPAIQWDIPRVEAPEPTRLGEVPWLEPYPDALLGAAGAGGPGGPGGPGARYEEHEAISLAFVTALQALPPRQVAVLILRDVLGFRASEVAGMLDATVDSVNNLLKRARTGLQRERARAGAGAAGREPPA